MLKNNLKGLNKRKARIFFFFLMVSSLIWFLNALSKTYTAKTTFELNYVNSNQDMILSKTAANEVEVKLRTIGFQFLGFNFRKNQITLDLANVEKVGGRYFLPEYEYRNQIEKQLSNSMQLIEISSNSLFFDFLELVSKKVKVDSNIKINLGQNHLMYGNLIVEPALITIRGPKQEIDTINKVNLVEFDFPEMTNDFSIKAKIYKSAELKYTSYSVDAVVIKGQVAKFSEKIVEVPIDVINQPEDRQVRIFPDKVLILCKAKIEDLKDIGANDFKVVADYARYKNTQSNVLKLKITEEPKHIFISTLMEANVEYILNKK